MSQINQAPGEVSDSLTGFDEMSITQHFGKPVTDLFADDYSMWMRSLVFTVKRRDGLNDDDARNAALGMTLGEVAEFFALDEDDEPAESGKDQSSSESPPESLSESRPEPSLEPQPASSLSSVS